MKNTLNDLENHLYSLLELADDDDFMSSKENVENLVQRSKIMSDLSGKILEINNLKLNAIKTASDAGLIIKNMPSVLGIETQ